MNKLLNTTSRFPVEVLHDRLKQLALDYVEQMAAMNETRARAIAESMSITSTTLADALTSRAGKHCRWK